MAKSAGRGPYEVDLWKDGTIKSFFSPGGILLLGVIALLQSHFFHISTSIIHFYFAATFGAGLLLAWRFHSTRIFFALAILFLADRGMAYFSAGVSPGSPAAQTAFDAVALLLPLNFVLLAVTRERAFASQAVVTRLLLVFLQAVFVMLICRPDHSSTAVFLHGALFNRHWFTWTRVPQLGLLAFVGGLTTFVVRFFLYRKPIESGFFWSLLSLFLAFQLGGVSRMGTAYLATSALALLASVIETSYVMAYHDELTGLPGRRAFNEALLGLPERYAIAIVDVDHFKNFNDKYGHETGDHVLRMVSTRLARVTGGGKAYRCGGEEFAVLFPDRSARDVLDDLERLRGTIEQSRLRVRKILDRRTASRGTPDRRNRAGKKPALLLKKATAVTAGREVSVTVSIGVAEPSTSDRQVDQVIRAADKALYTAKEGGRNRVELSSPARPRVRAAAKASPA